MGRLFLTSVFMLISAAIAAETIDAVRQALVDGEASGWLVVGYTVLKLTVALAFTVFVLIRAPARRRAREPIAYLACGAAILPAVLQVPAQSAPPALVLAGEGIALLGCAWMLVATLALGRCFGVLPEARGLVTHGPYSLVRHPLYLGELTAMGGLIIASPSLRNLVAGALFAAAQALRMRLEERALSREFPEYRTYAARTPRIVPPLHRITVARAARRLRRGAASIRADYPHTQESGQTVLEYALIGFFVAVVSVAGLSVLGSVVSNLINGAAQAL